MKYRYKPKNKEELIKAIKKEIFKIQGTSNNPNWKADLNCIDTSLITDMSFLFAESGSFFEGYNLEQFNGNISKWNTKNVKNMAGMFVHSKFDRNISNWNVGNVENMEGMFWSSKFNRDISKWNVSNVKNMSGMFRYSQFNKDISNWDVNNVKDMSWMFYKSKFNGNISNWNVSNVENMNEMFRLSKFNRDISKWNVSNIKYMNWMFENSKFNQDIGSWPLKETTGLENISVFPEYNKLPDKIIYPETIANIFIRSIKYSGQFFNIKNFKRKFFKEFLNNRKEIYKNKGYKTKIINKLILNDIADILKYLKDKDIQKKFMKITMNQDGKEPDIEIS